MNRRGAMASPSSRACLSHSRRHALRNSSQAATTPVHVTKLLKLADELVFSFDGDAAGRRAQDHPSS